MIFLEEINTSKLQNSNTLQQFLLALINHFHVGSVKQIFWTHKWGKAYHIRGICTWYIVKRQA